MLRYIELNQDKTVKKIYDWYPKWYDGDPDQGGQILSLTKLRELNVYPLIEDEPDFDRTKYKLERKPENEWQYLEDKVVVTYDLIPLNFPNAKQITERVIKETRRKKVTEPITYNEHTFTLNEQSKLDLLYYYTLFSLDMTLRTIKWKTDDGWIDLSKNDVKNLLKLYAKKVKETFEKEYELLDAVSKSTDLDSLHKIPIDFASKMEGK
jgi:hypothetical protein